MRIDTTEPHLSLFSGCSERWVGLLQWPFVGDREVAVWALQVSGPMGCSRTHTQGLLALRAT